MNNDYAALLLILEKVLGTSHKGVSYNGQAQFACPFCGSGKPNLEISLQKGMYNSWCCPENHGSLYSLIKEMGGKGILCRYIEESKKIDEINMYNINMYNINNANKIDGKISLPMEAKPLLNPILH